MTMMAHILKRDLRRTRWFLVAVLVLLAALCATPWIAFARAGGNRAEANLMNAYVALCLAYGVAVLALARKLVVEDAPLRETAFWRTRPLRPGTVLGAKLLYAAVFMVALPVASTLPWGAGMTAEEWLDGARKVALAQVSLTVLGVSVAMLWRSMLVGLLVVIGGYLLFAVSSLQTLMDIAVRRTELQSYFGYALQGTRAVLAIGLWGAGLCWAMTRAYWHADQRRGLIGLAGAITAAAAVMLYWPWAFLPATWTAPGPMTADEKPAAAEQLRFEANLAGTNMEAGGVWGAIRRDARDERLWEIQRIETRLAGSDGGTRTVYPALFSASGMMGEGPDLGNGIKTDALGGFGRNTPTFPLWLRGMGGAAPTSAQASLVVDAFAVRHLKTRMETGASAGSGGDRLRVSGSSIGESRVEVNVVDLRPPAERGSERHAGLYLLANEARKTAVSYSSSLSTRFFDGFYRRCSLTRLQFERANLGGGDDEAIRAWLKDARLVRSRLVRDERFAVKLPPLALPAAR